MSADDTGHRFVRAVSRRDWVEVEALFQPPVQFRALVPGGLREASNRGEASAWFRTWFGEADAVELVGSTVESMADKLRISYRLRVHEAQWRIVEQQAFCLVEGDRIQRMDLLCSGFRPDIRPPGGTPS